MSKFFQELPAIYIETWLKINDSDELISTLYFTLRDLFTVIKNMDVPQTMNKSFYLGKQAERVPRFDKIITEAKYLNSSKRS